MEYRARECLNMDGQYDCDIEALPWGPTLVVTQTFDLPDMFGAQSTIYNSREEPRCFYENSFHTLRDHGRVMGFRWDTSTMGGGMTNVNNIMDHWQGSARLYGQNSDHMVLTRSDDDFFDDSGFAIVQFDSFSNNGAQWSSNLTPLNSQYPQSVNPPSGDRMIRWINAVSPLSFNTYGHPGGVATFGDAMVTVLHSPKNVGEPSIKTELHIWDFQDPSNPKLIQAIDTTPQDDEELQWASVTRLHTDDEHDGKYVIVVASKDYDKMIFYISSSTDIFNADNPWTHFYTWLASNPDTISQLPNTGNLEFEKYQNVSILSDCLSGELYIVASDKNKWSGKDWLDMWKIDATSNNQIEVIKQGERHMHCSAFGAKWCDYDAGGNAYVDKNGNLLVYSTNRDYEEEDGDFGSRFMQFAATGYSDAPAMRVNVEFVGCSGSTPKFIVDWWVSANGPVNTYTKQYKQGSGSYHTYSGGNGSIYYGASNRNDIFRVMACNDIGCGSYGSDNTGSVSCGGSGGGGGGGVEPF